MSEDIASWVAAIGAFLTGLAACGAALAWHSQMQGKTEYELALRVLKAVYHLRSQIKLCRHLGSSKRGLALHQEYETRFKPVFEAQDDLYTIANEIAALWDEEKNKALNPLHELVAELWSTQVEYSSLLEEGEKSSDHPKWRSLLYGGKDDDFAKRLDDAVRQAELAFRPFTRMGFTRKLALVDKTLNDEMK